MAFAEDQKRKGDSAYKRKDWFAANSAYTQALKLNPPAEILHLLHSNRSATRLQLNDVNGAEEDARECNKLMPDWSRGWERLGTTLLRKGHKGEAKGAFKKALDCDPFNDNAQSKLREIENSNSSSSSSSNNNANNNNNTSQQNQNQNNNNSQQNQNQNNYQQNQNQYNYPDHNQNQEGIGSQISNWWSGLSSDTRMIITIGCVVLLLIVFLGRSRSSGYGYNNGYGSGFGAQEGGMFGILIMMAALWKVPPMFGFQPFFGMSPWTIFWLIRMFSNNSGGRRGRRRGYGGMGRGMGGMGGMGGFRRF